jgi:small redox-active disulfide protein 2
MGIWLADGARCMEQRIIRLHRSYVGQLRVLKCWVFHDSNTPTLHGKSTGGVKMKIEVLGPGCPKCQATEKNVHEAVRSLGLDAEVRHVTDIKEIASYGVFGTPAVVVDGQVKAVGKIPAVEEIRKWIRR